LQHFLKPGPGPREGGVGGRDTRGRGRKKRVFSGGWGDGGGNCIARARGNGQKGPWTAKRLGEG